MLKGSVSLWCMPLGLGHPPLSLGMHLRAWGEHLGFGARTLWVWGEQLGCGVCTLGLGESSIGFRHFVPGAPNCHLFPLPGHSPGLLQHCSSTTKGASVFTLVVVIGRGIKRNKMSLRSLVNHSSRADQFGSHPTICSGHLWVFNY